MSNDAMMSEKIDLLATALSKAQSVIESVGKDKQAYGYKYADLASCLHAVKKPLSENGLSISQLVTQDKDSKQVLVTLLIHESGQWLKSMFGIENVVMKQCNSLQQIGAGLTYARRYALSAIVGLAQEDDDAQCIKDVTKTEISVTKQKAIELFNLCNANRVDAKEFAVFHKVDSTKLETIEPIIANFESLKTQFLEASNATVNN